MDAQCALLQVLLLGFLLMLASPDVFGRLNVVNFKRIKLFDCLKFSNNLVLLS